MGITEALRMTWNALKIWWEVWLGLWLFGLVWVLCWITIVLGPPATFGFYHAIRWLLVEKETRWNEFYDPSKKYFLTSWLWFLVNLLVLYTVFANYVFYSNSSGSFGPVLQILALLIGFVWVAAQFYALPYFVLMEKKSLPLAWKNALFTILASPLFSLTVWMVLASLIFLHIFIMPVFLAGPGLVALLASLSVEDRIQRFGIRKQAVDETLKN
jgi:uncharacterized membrane protein YesL